MYVCLCKAVTDCQIRKAACEGICTMRELRSQLGVASQCGRCAQHAQHVLKETLNAAPCEENDKAA
ncbi:MAG: bacterioferritin-associated ferredoxin [Sulfuricaulis sp.]|uniref:bacterioferritin-associated ferredoxin n=1 Tax=Sulfuricaulis sp. TaxID=2003553 RepID=UPI0025E3452B|nr:bacterioferritin-associated ferredoxin [Sulfuricaulis sp.]MCR4346343.1 bacterioferritin-associated ferredoxin [Sulfuricaulis sp.]